MKNNENYFYWHKYSYEEPRVGRYLVTHIIKNNLFVDIATYHNYDGNHYFECSNIKINDKDILAWAELPSPYEE